MRNFKWLTMRSITVLLSCLQAIPCQIAAGDTNHVYHQNWKAGSGKWGNERLPELDSELNSKTFGMVLSYERNVGTSNCFNGTKVRGGRTTITQNVESTKLVRDPNANRYILEMVVEESITINAKLYRAIPYVTCILPNVWNTTSEDISVTRKIKVNQYGNTIDSIPGGQIKPSFYSTIDLLSGPNYAASGPLRNPKWSAYIGEAYIQLSNLNQNLSGAYLNFAQSILSGKDLTPQTPGFSFYEKSTQSILKVFKSRLNQISQLPPGSEVAFSSAQPNFPSLASISNQTQSSSSEYNILNITEYPNVYQQGIIPLSVRATNTASSFDSSDADYEAQFQHGLSIIDRQYEFARALGAQRRIERTMNIRSSLNLGQELLLSYEIEPLSYPIANLIDTGAHTLELSIPVVLTVTIESSISSAPITEMTNAVINVKTDADDWYREYEKRLKSEGDNDFTDIKFESRTVADWSTGEITDASFSSAILNSVSMDEIIQTVLNTARGELSTFIRVAQTGDAYESYRILPKVELSKNFLASSFFSLSNEQKKSRTYNPIRAENRFRAPIEVSDLEVANPNAMIRKTNLTDRIAVDTPVGKVEQIRTENLFTTHFSGNQMIEMAYAHIRLRYLEPSDGKYGITNMATSLFEDGGRVANRDSGTTRDIIVYQSSVQLPQLQAQYTGNAVSFIFVPPGLSGFDLPKIVAGYAFGEVGIERIESECNPVLEIRRLSNSYPWDPYEIINPYGPAASSNPHYFYAKIEYDEINDTDYQIQNEEYCELRNGSSTFVPTFVPSAYQNNEPGTLSFTQNPD